MKEYSEFQLNANTKSMDEICNIEKLEFQKHQKFCRKWFENGNSKMLLFHGLGSGKTLTSIYVAEGLLSTKQIKTVYAVTPASLKKNFEKEITSGLMNYKEVPKTYKVLSYQRFIKSGAKLDNCLIIIDEVQNIISEIGKLYKQFFDALVTSSPRNIKLVLLSGTPMFDKPHEFALTMNLLNIPKLFDVTKFYREYTKNGELVNTEEFMNRIYPYVSAFKGVSPAAYAKRKDEFVDCAMQGMQKMGYQMAIEAVNDQSGLSQAFLSGPRMAANIIYDNGGVGKKYKKTGKLKDILAPKNIKDHSIKFYKCIKNLKKSDKQTFVYTNFVASAGVEDFVLALKLHGFNSKEYGVFKTNQDENNKKLVERFNKGKIRIIIGSPAMKEGISLKNCREVHLLDPYWNQSRVNQVIGRAIRFCSHVSLPNDERKVKVYHYIAKLQGIKTVDEHIIDMATEKDKLIKKFENLIYKSAVDCPLFHRSTKVDVLDCFKTPMFVDVTKLQGFFEVVYNRSSDIYISINEKKEERLLEILKAQGIQKGSHLAFKVTLYVPKGNKSFTFKNSTLNPHIASIEHKQSNEHFAKIKAIIPKRITKKNKNKDETLAVKRKKKKLIFSSVPKVHYKLGRQAKGVKCKVPPENGECPDKQPFLRNECCHARPSKNSKGIIAGGGKVYVNGKYTKTMSLKQLTDAALKYHKLLKPKMKRLNIIKELSKNI